MRTAFRWLFFVALGAIVVGSLVPTSQVKSIFVVKDWLVHFTAYAFCGSLAAIGFASRPNRNRALLGLFLTGALIEIVQPYVGRHFGWYDLAANAMGTLAAAFAGTVWERTSAQSRNGN
ncbi:hypothetical protein ACFL2H_00890 [Planctomycetota bacterium]